MADANPIVVRESSVERLSRLKTDGLHQPAKTLGRQVGIKERGWLTPNQRNPPEPYERRPYGEPQCVCEFSVGDRWALGEDPHLERDVSPAKVLSEPAEQRDLFLEFVLADERSASLHPHKVPSGDEVKERLSNWCEAHPELARILVLGRELITRAEAVVRNLVEDGVADLDVEWNPPRSTYLGLPHTS